MIALWYINMPASSTQQSDRLGGGYLPIDDGVGPLNKHTTPMIIKYYGIANQEVDKDNRCMECIIVNPNA